MGDTARCSACVPGVVAPARVAHRLPGGIHWSWLPGLMVATCLLCGCQNAAYYAQAIRGQTTLLVNQTSVERLLAEPKTPPALRDHLRLAGDLCRFARDELHLKVDGNYRRYVEVGRKFVVWNVEAAPEFSLEARRWWYPFVGRLSYRGFFGEASARACARELERDGLDVMIGGVPAYSTLGWFRDPLLSTFLFDPEAELAETIFHELAHEKVFARGDTDYNEAFATSVGEEGVRRWFRARRDEAGARAYEASRRHHASSTAWSLGRGTNSGHSMGTTSPRREHCARPATNKPSPGWKCAAKKRASWLN